MCGITGIQIFNAQENHFLDKVKSATQTLSKRGPDFQDVYSHHNTSLGHARLSIIDTSEGANQPFTDNINRYTIVYNGEIYNYKELKKELELSGIQFKTQSDTEVLLYSYIKWGKVCLDKLNGFFSFAIFDKNDGSLFLARDRFGIKPLLYYQDENKFIFGSELKSIMAYGIKKKINHVALTTYFQINYIPAPLCILEGVKKLEPGHYIQVKNQQISIQQWYKIPFSENGTTNLTYPKAQEKLVELLSESVKKRLVADVPLGTFLSGGIDSSIISTLASEHKKDLQTFSIGYKDNPFFDETSYAELVAKKIKSNHTTFKLSNNDLLEDLYGFFNYIDEPFADSSAIAVDILSNRTQKQVTVSLSGDGADELFSGYNKHSAEYKVRNSRINTFYKLLSPIVPLLPKSKSSKLGNTSRLLSKYLVGLNLNPKDRYWLWASLMDANNVNKLLKNYVNNSEIKEKYTAVISDSKSLNDLLYADTELVLPNDMLTKVDLMSMKNSLEVRVPFLDHSIVEFAFSLPSNYKIDSNQRKKILQDAFRNKLPKELYNRQKKGFEIPIEEWLKKELKKEISDNLLDRDFIEDQGIFNSSKLESLVAKLNSNNPENTAANIWAILVFQKCWKNYFNA